jgi:hypothetical protein
MTGRGGGGPRPRPTANPATWARRPVRRSNRPGSRDLKTFRESAVLTGAVSALPWCRTKTDQPAGSTGARQEGSSPAGARPWGGGAWGDPPPRARWAGGPCPVRDARTQGRARCGWPGAVGPRPDGRQYNCNQPAPSAAVVLQPPAAGPCSTTETVLGPPGAVRLQPASAARRSHAATSPGCPVQCHCS